MYLAMLATEHRRASGIFRGSCLYSERMAAVQFDTSDNSHWKPVMSFSFFHLQDTRLHSWYTRRLIYLLFCCLRRRKVLIIVFILACFSMLILLVGIFFLLVSPREGAVEVEKETKRHGSRRPGGRIGREKM